MKKLSKLKLNVLSDINLRDREMNGLKGGNVCTCSCYWEGQPGGASSSSNMSANTSIGSGGHSSNGCNQYGWADGMDTDEYAYCSSCNESNPGHTHI